MSSRGTGKATRPWPSRGRTVTPGWRKSFETLRKQQSHDPTPRIAGRRRHRRNPFRETGWDVPGLEPGGEDSERVRRERGVVGQLYPRHLLGIRAHPETPLDAVAGLPSPAPAVTRTIVERDG